MKWISIEERLPPLDAEVLIAKYDGRPKVEMYFVRTAYRLNDQWFEPTHGEEITMKGQVITHWMPLPDAPDRHVSRICVRCNKDLKDNEYVIVHGGTRKEDFSTEVYGYVCKRCYVPFRENENL